MKWAWLLAIAAGLLISSDTLLSERQKSWLASFQGQPLAQYQTGLRFWQKQQASAALYWWQKALSGGSVQARKRLLRLFPAHQMRWHRLSTEAGIQASVRPYAEAQLADKNISWEAWKQRWYQTVYQQPLADYFSAIKQWVANPSCQADVQVSAADASLKQHFIRLLLQLDAAQPTFPGLCFSFSVNPALDCSVDTENQRPQCRSQSADAAVKNHQPRVILTERGSASASPSQIVLTRDSDANVLLHELGHWWGLADEYTMAPELAENFCRGRYDFSAYNVVVTQNDTMTSRQLKDLWRSLPWSESVADWRRLGQQSTDGLWQLGSDQGQAVGLFAADTCSEVAGVMAWKPVSAVTAMEQHQSAYWPPLYRQWIAAQIANAN